MMAALPRCEWLEAALVAVQGGEVDPFDRIRADFEAFIKRPADGDLRLNSAITLGHSRWDFSMARANDFGFGSARVCAISVSSDAGALSLCATRFAAIIRSSKRSPLMVHRGKGPANDQSARLPNRDQECQRRAPRPP